MFVLVFVLTFVLVFVVVFAFLLVLLFVLVFVFEFALVISVHQYSFIDVCMVFLLLCSIILRYYNYDTVLLLYGILLNNI